MPRPRRLSRPPRRASRGRPATKTTKQLKKQRQDRLGYFIFAVVIIVLALGGWFYTTIDHSPIDSETACPQDGATSITVVMIDGSDRITPRQQAFLRNHLEEIKGSVEVGGMIKVFSLGSDGDDVLTSLASACNPGRASDVNPFIGSKRRAQRLWEEVFAKRLDPAFDQLLTPAEAEMSPVFESIQSVGIDPLQNPDWRGKPRRMFIVSDMIQYMPEFNQYNAPGDFDEFSRSNYFRRVRTDLSGVEVTIYYLPRTTRNNVQGSVHLEFWKNYFLDQGARPGDPAFFVHVEG